MSETLHWFLQTLADVPEGGHWLSRGEQAILAGLRFPKRRNDWLLGRWTAKHAICFYQSHRDPVLSSLEIRAADDGAPEAYWNGQHADVSFSISHSNSRCMCVVGPPGHLLGCDLERIEQRDLNFFADYFAAEEMELLQNAPAERNLVAYLIWSAKESALKALREGLRRDTRSVRIQPQFPGPGCAWNPWTGHCLQSTRMFYGWWRACDDYVYTLTSDHPTSPPELIST